MDMYNTLFAKALSSGNAPAPVINELNVNANGTYTAPEGVNGYSPVNVNVPNTYTAQDEGKVVDNGALVAQTSTSFYDNGTYNTTTNDSVTVAVPLTTKSITSNGTYNASSDSAKGYTSVSVSVPNTYTTGDEGKVVSNGALVSQTSTSITTNNTTVDTTLNNSVTVNVPVPQPTLITKSITSNGTYNASSDSADGYSSVSVAVPNTYTASDEGKVVSQGALVSQTATSTNVNGTIDTTLNNSIVVNVPNTYTQSDEGKVVSNGILVPQTSTIITTNNTTVDTTLINSVDVQVPASTFPYPSIGLYGSATSTDVAPTWYMTITKAQTSNTSLHKIYWSVCGVISSGYGQTVTRYPIGYNLSDYFTQDETMTIVGVKRGYNSTVNITVTIRLATNTVEFGAYTFPPSGAGALYCFNYKQLDAKIYN